MPSPLTRRTLIAGVTSLGIATVASGGEGALINDANWLPGEPTEAWRHLLRMQMSTLPEDVPWWYTGRIYAQVGDSAPEHLMNIEGTEIYWVRELSADSYAISGRTLTFFLDKDSGEMLREFVNPYTGQKVRVEANRLGGRDGSIYSAAGWRFTSSAMHQPEPNPWQAEWHRAETLVWLTSSRFSKALPQPWLESMTVFCPLQALLDTSLQRLPAHFTSTYLSPWPRWLQMDGHPGHLVWHSSGKKLNSADQIPAAYRRRVDAEYGGLLSARPETWEQ